MATPMTATGSMPPYGGAQFNPQDYGAAPVAYPMQMGLGPADRGGFFGSGKLFLRSTRRRLNAVPLFLALFMPWGVFSVVYGATTFSVHYQNPALHLLIVGCVFVAVLVVGLMAVSTRLKLPSTPEREPSWLIFLAFSMLLAWVLGFLIGDRSYIAYTRPYCDMMNLNSYTDIDPTRMRGQQLMDAGTIQFAEGARLDIAKSMGFKNSRVYCVAPVILGNSTLPTYDFWAVGTGCCSGNQADFHCQGWNSPHSRGGLRLMSDASRAFYRLAVQQAEATYGIKAVHPLFFTWVSDPMGLLEGWRSAVRTEFFVWTFAHLGFQAFLVASAALVFAKIGHS